MQMGNTGRDPNDSATTWLTEASLVYTNSSGLLAVNFSTDPQGNFLLRSVAAEVFTLTGIKVPLPADDNNLPSLSAEGERAIYL